MHPAQRMREDTEAPPLGTHGHGTVAVPDPQAHSVLITAVPAAEPR